MKRLTTLLLLAGALAQAQPRAAAEAKQRFAHGQELVAAGRFADALGEFERGYQLSHRPLFLFNIAECARQGGDPLRARESYARYLKEDPDGPMVVTARARLDALAPAAPPPMVPREEPPAPPPPSLPPPRAVEPAPQALIATSTAPPPAKKRWGLWLGVGAGALVVGVVAISLGATLGGHHGAGCSGDCTTVDLRR